MLSDFQVVKVTGHNIGFLFNRTDELTDLSWITVLNIIGANELWRHDDSRDYEISFRAQKNSSIKCVKVFNVSKNCKGFEGNEVCSEHVHKLPRRAQVKSTFYNGISLRVRQRTVFNSMINKNVACSKR